MSSTLSLPYLAILINLLTPSMQTFNYTHEMCTNSKHVHSYVSLTVNSIHGLNAHAPYTPTPDKLIM